jgi:hypothetical protein
MTPGTAPGRGELICLPLPHTRILSSEYFLPFFHVRTCVALRVGTLYHIHHEDKATTTANLVVS